MFFIDNDNIIVFTTNTVVRTVIGQLVAKILKNWNTGMSATNTLKFTINLIVEVDSVVTTIILVITDRYMCLVATICLFAC